MRTVALKRCPHCKDVVVCTPKIIRRYTCKECGKVHYRDTADQTIRRML